MKVQFLALGDRDTASSRIRAWDLSEWIAAIGHSVSSRVGPSKLTLIELAFSRRIDVIVLQKWVPPAWVLFLIQKKSKVLIFDCDDAIYLDTSHTRDRRIEDRTRDRFGRLLRSIDGATVSMPTIASDLTKIEPELRTLVYAGPRPALSDDATTVRRGVIWLGSPATESYLWKIQNDLIEIDREVGFTAVGGSELSELQGLSVAKWSLERQRDFLSAAKVGLFVQEPGAWEQRKSGYKLLEYISAGLIPVSERNDASVALLGHDYPFFAEQGRWRDVISRAHELPEHERQSTVKSLQLRTEPLEARNIATAWEKFVIERSRGKL
jgi:hypothetical protein